MTDLLSTRQAAEALGVTSRTVKRWCEQGLIRHIKLRKLYKIRRSDLQLYLSGEREIQEGEKDAMSTVQLDAADDRRSDD